MYGLRSLKPTRWIPPESEEIQHPRGLGVCYLYPSRDGRGMVALAYAGKQTKAVFHCQYSDFGGTSAIEKARAKIASFWQSLEHWESEKASRRAKRQEAHTLQVGDVVVNSWGWEQTNVDFYRVVKTSANFVWLAELGSQMVPGRDVSAMSGYCIPATSDKHSGKPAIKHRADSSGYVHFKHGGGSKWDGGPQYVSWYA